MKNNHTRNLIDKMKEQHGKPRFEITGVTFVLDNPDHFDPYTKEACKTSGFFDEKQPQPEGFFYLSDEYERYLISLKETKQEHPANTNNLQWALSPNEY